MVEFDNLSLLNPVGFLAYTPVEMHSFGFCTRHFFAAQKRTIFCVFLNLLLCYTGPSILFCTSTNTHIPCPIFPCTFSTHDMLMAHSTVFVPLHTCPQIQRFLTTIKQKKYTSSFESVLCIDIAQKKSHQMNTTKFDFSLIWFWIPFLTQFSFSISNDRWIVQRSFSFSNAPIFIIKLSTRKFHIK